MSKTETVRARIEPATKEAVLAILDPMGLTMSDAVRMFLIRVAARGEFAFNLECGARQSTASEPPSDEALAGIRDVQRQEI